MSYNSLTTPDLSRFWIPTELSFWRITARIWKPDTTIAKTSKHRVFLVFRCFYHSKLNFGEVFGPVFRCHSNTGPKTGLNMLEIWLFVWFLDVIGISEYWQLDTFTQPDRQDLNDLIINGPIFDHVNWPSKPSGLSRHVSNSSRDRRLGSRFESHSRHVYMVA